MSKPVTSRSHVLRQLLRPVRVLVFFESADLHYPARCELITAGLAKLVEPRMLFNRKDEGAYVGSISGQSFRLTRVRQRLFCAPLIFGEIISSDSENCHLRVRSVATQPLLIAVAFAVGPAVAVGWHDLRFWFFELCVLIFHFLGYKRFRRETQHFLEVLRRIASGEPVEEQE